MDEHNVHHFWGISPALDLGSLLPTGDGVAVLPVDQPIRILQAGAYDSTVFCEDVNLWGCLRVMLAPRQLHSC